MTRALHVAHDGAGVDLEAARRAAADFLSALGVAIDTEDLRDTPARMARAYAELFDARTEHGCPSGRKDLEMADPLAWIASVALVLRVTGGHRGRRAAGQDRHRRRGHAARPGRDRQRAAGLPALRADARLAALDGAGRSGARPQRPLRASTSVRDLGLPRHPVRDRAGRARRGQHHARGHPARGRRPRPGTRGLGARPLRRRAAGAQGTGGDRRRLRRRDRETGEQRPGRLRRQLAGSWATELRTALRRQPAGEDSGE